MTADRENPAPPRTTTPDHASDGSAARTPRLSVGRIAKATGISVDTLRMWERRYGTPVPHRLPSGHRRYSEEQLRRLRRVAEGLSRGHRAGTLLQLSDAELDELLAVQEPEASDPELDAWFEHARRLDDIALRDAVAASMDEHEPAAWLSKRIAPFLRRVGREWADGTLEVRHEHLVSEVVGELVAERRQQVRAATPLRVERPVLATTLPGEEHGLGLAMVSLLCATQGVPCRRLGVETPLEDIARAAAELDACAVALSVSLATGGVETDRVLIELRDMLPDGCELVVGGEGARGPRRGPRGVRVLKSSARFLSWLRGLD